MPAPSARQAGVQERSSAPDWNRTNDTGFRRAVLYPLSYEGAYPLFRQGRSVRTRIPAYKVWARTTLLA